MVGRFSPRESVADLRYRNDLTARLTYELVPMKSVETAIEALPPGSPVSVTCSPVKGIDATIALTDRLRALGHHAVPHIAARMVEGPSHLTRISAWLRTEAIDEVFVVGGDAERPRGPYDDASAVLADLLDTDSSVQTIGLPAYPDGHPFIEERALHDALETKQAMLAEAGVAGYVSTQMCFDPAKIDLWLHAQRNQGLTLPVHLGVAGVIDRAKLMTMGLRLGVGASLRYARKNRGALLGLFTSNHYDPNKLLEPLSPILETAGVTGIHCFTFNQVAATAAWQKRTLERR